MCCYKSSQIPCVISLICSFPFSLTIETSILLLLFLLFFFFSSSMRFFCGLEDLPTQYTHIHVYYITSLEVGVAFSFLRARSLFSLFFIFIYFFVVTANLSLSCIDMCVKKNFYSPKITFFYLFT